MAKLLLFETRLRDGELPQAFNPAFEQWLEIALTPDRAGTGIVESAPRKAAS